MKYSEKLEQRYATEISEWPWDKWESTIYENLQFSECEDSIEATVWLGTVLALLPSGKIYMPWTINQTMRDVIQDRAFSEALNSCAEEHGWYVDQIDDSLYLGRVVDDVYDCFFYREQDEHHEETGFYRDGELTAITESELYKVMVEDGYFPGVYTVSLFGDLSLYQWESNR